MEKVNDQYEEFYKKRLIKNDYSYLRKFFLNEEIKTIIYS